MNNNSGLLVLTNGNTLQVNGDFYNSGTVQVQFNESGQIGILNVAGPATLNGGTLTIFGSSFNPAIGTRYRFMTFTNRGGYFATTDVNNFPAGKTASVDQSDPTYLELVIEPI
ncbi:hypothetical protein L0222_05990 [bacterium]|nr:hypothetical protein [bacterium]MCI0602979.1 hypothetical protein [bacterium]